MTEPNRDAHLESLLAAHRFGEVGRCVNSVTHGANNALGAILAYADLISMEPGIEGEALRMLDEIAGATRKVSDQLNWLTDIARPAPAGKSVARPNVIVDRAVAMRHYEAHRLGIKIDASVPDTLPEVSVDVPETVRAVIHLLVNAIDAVADCENKRVTIDGKEGEKDVVIAVQDTAHPIPEAVAARMFEPFYTTKGGHHLGLGLSAACRAAESNGGTLTYEPTRGFLLTLPAAEF